MATKSQTNRQEQVRRANAAFEKLSPSDKRVAIARDVLAQLDAGRITAEAGVYVRSFDLVNLIEESAKDAQLQNLLPEVEECNVCALGSMFICGVNIANKLPVKGLTTFEEEVSGSDAKKYLRRFFTNGQLGLIESAFETGDMLDNYSRVSQHDANLLRAAILFGQLFDLEDDYQTGDELRLRAIMENIIVNKGTFRPDIQPRKRWVTEGFTG
jgi:hypothetical protein